MRKIDLGNSSSLVMVVLGQNTTRTIIKSFMVYITAAARTRAAVIVYKGSFV